MAIDNLESLLTPPALRIAKEKELASTHHYRSPTRNSSASTSASMNRDSWGLQPQSLTVIKKRRDTHGQAYNNDYDEGSSSDSVMNLDSPGHSEL